MKNDYNNWIDMFKIYLIIVLGVTDYDMRVLSYYEIDSTNRDHFISNGWIDNGLPNLVYIPDRMNNIIKFYIIDTYDQFQYEIYAYYSNNHVITTQIIIYDITDFIKSVIAENFLGHPVLM